jgi:uncharacterized protein involved in exopolysaccharide biosynthesis
VTIEPLVTDMSAAATTNNGKEDQRPGQSTSSVPGFTLSYVASDPNEAQEVCSQLTTMMLDEDQKLREQRATAATDFLNRELDRVGHDLDELGAKIADFKKQSVGQSAEQYKRLSLDYDATQSFYKDLLANKIESEMRAEMESQQLGEQLRLLGPASQPDSLDFPNRALFAVCGLGVGLVVGIALWLWLWFKRVSQIPA